MQIRLRKIVSLFLIIVIVLNSLLFNGGKMVQAEDKKTGGIEEVNENVIRGWATSPGEGNGGGNTIKFFIVKVQIKGNNASEVSYRVDATEVPSSNGEKKYTFTLDMTGRWPNSNNPNVTYEIEVDAYRIVGNGKEEKYFTFPTPAYEYQQQTSNVNNPSLDFTVSASQNEYAKPLNEDAQGRLDITLIPQGRVDTPLRPPIDVVLYSIGFGDHWMVDLNYLEKLSSITGGVAKKGTEQNLSSIFQEFSTQENDPSLTGTIEIPLKNFNGKVNIIEDGNVRLDENKQTAYINFNINYKVGQGTPPPVYFSVPVTFKAEGTYQFDVELNYRDIYGNAQPVKEKSVTVNVVKDEVPPTFTGTVQLKGITNEVDNLIKYGNEDGDSNQFIAEYTLTPVGYVGKNVTGQLSNIKIIQPIPDGLSVVPSPNVSVRQENGKTYADISLPDVVHYSNSSFTPAALTASVQLQADCAMENMQLPQATVSFTDSRYGNQVTTLPASNPVISMKVRLPEFPNIYYEADSRGIISKWQQSLGLIASASYLNNGELLNQPVRAMAFKPGTNDTVIVITYKNGETSELYMIPQLKIVNDDGTTVSSGATVTEPVKVVISHFVAGDGVAYEYQIDHNRISDKSWKPLNAPFEIPIDVEGTSIIKVRSIGGFTKGDGIATVEITYHKLVNQIVLEPYNNEMNVNEVQTLQATVLPSDATNKDVRWSSSNPSVASVENGVVTALSPGRVTIHVEALDGSGVMATANITVVDPTTVPLESIRFRQPTLSIALGEKIPVVSLLEFNPSNATNKRLESVLSSASQYVEVTNENGQWYLTARNYGYSTVTAIAEERTNDGQDIQDSIVIIVTKPSNGGGNNGGDSEVPRGKW